MDGIQLNITTSRSLKRKALPNADADAKLKKADENVATNNSKASDAELTSTTEPSSVKEANVPAGLSTYPAYKSLHNLDLNPVVDEGEVKIGLGETLFCDSSFQSAALHPFLVKNMTEKMGFTKMTLVQKLGIPIVQKGGDVLVKSQTGSGKTLVYALPIVNALGTANPPITRSDGVHCLVVLPTRELAVQSFDTFHNLCQAFIKVTPGCLSGGEKKKSEKARLRKGINILVSTPGRLLDHLKTSANLSLSISRLQYLVIDEADRLLEAGFEQQISEILYIIKQGMGEKQWQTILLSATLTPAVERLASLSLRQPEFIDVQALCGKNDSYGFTDPIMAVPEKLKQYYAVTPTKLKLAALTAFLLHKREHKIVIFFPTQDVVEFFFSLYENVMGELCAKFPSTKTTEKPPLFRLHGEMSQSERSDVFRRFSQSKNGFLFSTDVAARGLDLPSITWVAQFQAPESPAVYVHRAGRTARAGHAGSSILFLIPNESQYVKLMRQDYGLNIKSVRFSSITAALEGRQTGAKGDDLRVIFDIQHAVDEAVSNDKKLNDMARKGYISFVRAYATYRHDQRQIFNVRNGLHFGHVARCFGLKNETPTEVNNILRRNNNYAPRQHQQQFNRPSAPYPNNNNNNNHSAEHNNNLAGSAYPQWQGSTYAKQHEGFKFESKAPTGGHGRIQRGTKVVSGQRVGGRSGYQVAMQSCSEFASGL